MLAGRRQVFVRTYGCNLRCTYCDSPETLRETPSPAFCRVETQSGSGRFCTIPNPVSLHTLTHTVQSFLHEPHHSLSLTGGEPLLQARFWQCWLPQTAGWNLPVFLETNGMLPAHLQMVLPYISLVSMDYKAPSATGMPYEKSRDLQREFLQVASARQVYMKLVVTPHTSMEELDCAVQLLNEVYPIPALILQPVTPCGYETEPVQAQKLFAMHAHASRALPDVRIIPQLHKAMHLL